MLQYLGISHIAANYIHFWCKADLNEIKECQHCSSQNILLSKPVYSGEALHFPLYM